MGDARDSDAPAPPLGQLRQRARQAYRRGAERWGEAQPPVDPDHLLHLWTRQRGRCAVSGLLFSDERFEGALVPHPYRASLDRIDPLKPYLEGNMRLVCTAANFGMGQWGDAVLRRIAEGMTARRGSDEERTVWYAERYEEIGRLELALDTASAEAAAVARRRIAALKRAVTLGPEGLGKAAARAARRRRKRQDEFPEPAAAASTERGDG